ncbi:MAG: PD-(D/E)XK nuclease family transposase [Planctomycetota bacterium]|nr:PD-(D/E)XK nuclease family transposase [Planctomycetota bacterium]
MAIALRLGERAGSRIGSTPLCSRNDQKASLIHVIELPKFTRTLGELRTPLDFWLYFFKNGAGLDADALPEAINRPEQRKAMGVLKMLAQSDVERELYEFIV